MTTEHLIDDVKTLLREAGFGEIASQAEEGTVIVSARKEGEQGLFRWARTVPAGDPPASSGGGPTTESRPELDIAVVPLDPSFAKLITSDPGAAHQLKKGVREEAADR
jgi:hypothetical protein